MEEALDLKNYGRYNWLLTIFYIAYILFQPTTLMWKAVPPHMWATFTVLCWGLFATLQSTTTSWGGMMALRFLLGAVEAGFGPGIPFLLSFFYLRHEVGLRVGMFLSAAPLASCFAGALAYGITSGHSHLANWRLLFLVEGIPTILMAPICWFFIPDAPEKARFLNEEERKVAKARSIRQAGAGKERVGGVDWKDVGRALADPIPWFTAFMYFSCNVSYASLPVFLPTILKDMGFTSINAQGLTAPPYFVSFLVTIITPYIADKMQQRGLMIFVLSMVAGIGYILVATVESVGVRYFGVFLAASGVFPAIANILPWVTNNQGSDSRRGAGIALLNLVGQCGPLLGTNVFPTTGAPRYVEGFSVCAAFIFFNGILAMCLRTLLVYKNKKLDEQYGTKDSILEQRAREKAEGKEIIGGEAEENYGPMFRYVL
jgi:Major Facilitator Superfamily